LKEVKKEKKYERGVLKVRRKMIEIPGHKTYETSMSQKSLM